MLHGDGSLTPVRCRYCNDVATNEIILRGRRRYTCRGHMHVWQVKVWQAAQGKGFGRLWRLSA